MRGLDNIFSVRAESNCFHATVTIDTFKTSIFKISCIFLKNTFAFGICYFLLSTKRLSQKKLMISSGKQHLMDQRFHCKWFFLTRPFIVFILQ
jgi:hypothetical protein